MNVRLLLLILIVLFSATSFAAVKEAAAIRPGAFVGLNFGYLDTDYDEYLDLYAPGRQAKSPQGSDFSFRVEAGYNVNRWWGIGLGGLSYQDQAKTVTNSPAQSAKVDISSVDFLALIHLPLNAEHSWVGTLRPGLALMTANLKWQLSLDDQYDESSDRRTILVPTMGLVFEHSYNQHWIINLMYQYYYADYTDFHDPLNTPISSLDYFGVGMSYKF